MPVFSDFSRGDVAVPWAGLLYVIVAVPVPKDVNIVGILSISRKYTTPEGLKARKNSL